MTDAPNVKLLGEPRRYPERIARLEAENARLRAAVVALLGSSVMFKTPDLRAIGGG